MPFMTIPIALAITGAATAGTSIYQARRAGQTNDRALDAQRAQDSELVALERERLAEEKAAREANIQRDRERWQEYLKINEPFWKAGAGVLDNLYDVAGMSGQAPSFQTPTQPPPGTGAPAGAPLPSSGVATGPQGTGAPMTTGPRRPRGPVVTPQTPQAMNLQQLMMLAQNAGRGAPSWTGDALRPTPGLA